jgi:dienelactone hydrolase
LSDDTGWAWDADRTKYNTARDNLLGVATVVNGQKEQQQQQQQQHRRPVLQQRIRAAIDTLTSTSTSTNLQVDPDNLAALGWCLGGHSILELGLAETQTQIPMRMRAMATFHGVFDGLPPPPAALENDEDDDDNGSQTVTATKKTEILICRGTEDPFCSDESIERALQTLTHNRNIVSLLQLQGSKHGFTNPAQDFNENPAFGFDQVSADKAWRQTMALLRRACAPDPNV